MTACLHAASVACDLQADATLRPRGHPDGTIWVANGDHAGFRFGTPVATTGLPAGWYALRGHIECLEGTIMLPSLRCAYVGTGVNAAEETPLPEPPISGLPGTLVRFKHPVADLRLCPGVWAACFRLRDFSLRRVSRTTALWMMLTRAGQSMSLRVGMRRSIRFLARLCVSGLGQATDWAFSNYLERRRPAGLGEYDVWVRKYDTFTPSRLEGLRRRVQASVDTPLSVLMTVQNGSVKLLCRRLDGLCGQLWRSWELCVVADASCDAAIMKVLADYSARDRRVRVAPIVEKDAVTAFNRSLAMATADHVIVLGPQTELRRHALLELSALRQRHHDLAFAYADEDAMDADGCRVAPYFKPDWNPDLLRSQNYIGAMAMIDTALVRQVGGLHDDCADSVLHDLFLRCTERVDRSRILHVPRILYHRLEVIGQVDFVRCHVPDIAVKGALAVAAHLSRQGVCASVDARPGRTFHVHWPLPLPRPKISLVIPTRDQVDLLRACIDSIVEKTTWPNLEIVVVDNGSSERGTLDYLDVLRRRERVRVLRDDSPFNYAIINNRAVEQCDGELVCLLNNDVEVISPHWLEEMAGHGLRPGVGAVGAMLYYPDGSIQHAGVVVGMHDLADHLYAGRPHGWPGHGGRARVAQELSAVTAACLLVHRTKYLRVGGLDERLAVAFNDVDFCLRLREHGLHNIWTPHAELYHHESASRGRDDAPDQLTRTAAEMAYMRRRWGNILGADPAYSPNLSLRASGVGLAFPPRWWHATCTAPH